MRPRPVNRFVSFVRSMLAICFLDGLALLRVFCFVLTFRLICVRGFCLCIDMLFVFSTTGPRFRLVVEMWFSVFEFFQVCEPMCLCAIAKNANFE